MMDDIIRTSSEWEEFLHMRSCGTKCQVMLCHPSGDYPPVRAVVLRGVHSGKTIWLQGGIHGDEYDGPVALSQLEEELQPEMISGTVIIVPLVNPMAFAGQSNGAPRDHVNLNRVFGVSMEESFSVEYGRWLLSLIQGVAEAVVDLHGGGQYMDVCSFATVIEGDTSAAQESLSLAQCSGVTFIHRKPSEGNGMLVAELVRQNIPAVLLEQGGGLSTTQEAVSAHRRSVLAILNHMGNLIQGEVLPAGGQVSHGADVYFPSGGLLLYHAPVGMEMEKGQVCLQWRESETGQEQVLCAPMSGILLANHSCALVRKGQYAAMFGNRNDV